MDDIRDVIGEALGGGVYRVVLSSPADKDGYIKIVINRLGGAFQAEKYTEKQVFHENIATSELLGYVMAAFGDEFRQCNVWADDGCEFNIRLSKKGKILFGKKKSAAPPPVKSSHNRKKKYILEEGTIIEPLIDLGIFTKDGKVVSAMHDKYRQLNRFIEIINDEVEKTRLAEPVNIIDFGCGKSYLTFVIYYYFTQIKNMRVNMTGLDLKADVISRCNETARKYSYDGLKFEVGDINGYSGGGADIVISLHACDTATDYALFNAIKWNAKLIFCVPCCQHEANAQICSDEFSALTKYGIVKERLAALMTDSIRGCLLEHCGYKTQLLEFIDFDHTPKNILIRAKKVRPAANGRTRALDEAERLMKEFSLSPKLYELLDCQKSDK